MLWIHAPTTSWRSTRPRLRSRRLTICSRWGPLRSNWPTSIKLYGPCNHWWCNCYLSKWSRFYWSKQRWLWRRWKFRRWRHAVTSNCLSSYAGRQHFLIDVDLTHWHWFPNLLVELHDIRSFLGHGREIILGNYRFPKASCLVSYLVFQVAYYAYHYFWMVLDRFDFSYGFPSQRLDALLRRVRLFLALGPQLPLPWW